MTFGSKADARVVQRHRNGKPVAETLDDGDDQTAQRVALHPGSLTPRAVLHLQRLAGNRAAVSSIQRMCGVDPANIVVEDSAMKHKIGFEGQAPRLPTEEDVKKQFHINMRFGKPEPDDRDPDSTKVLGGKSKMVFKKTGDTYKVFHLHAYGYEGDKEASPSGGRPGGRGGQWQRGGGSSQRW